LFDEQLRDYPADVHRSKRTVIGSLREARMKRENATGFICISMLFFALSSPPRVAAAPADTARATPHNHPALWERAVAVFDENKDLVPGKVLQKIQELGDDGQVKSETDIETSIALNEAGKVKSTIVRASEDGKDVTAEQRKKAEEAEKKSAKRRSDEQSHSFSLGDGPFNAERQDDVRVAETKTHETVDGKSCTVFEYSYPDKSENRAKNRPAMIRGKAWIDESTGCPAKLQFTSNPLPKHVKSMVTTLRYFENENGSWVLRQMEFDVSGSFLFFGKRMRGDFTFGDYWKYEEHAQQK
jgi:hypothetical protein